MAGVTIFQGCDGSVTQGQVKGCGQRQLQTGVIHCTLQLCAGRDPTAACVRVCVGMRHTPKGAGRMQVCVGCCMPHEKSSVRVLTLWPRGSGAPVKPSGTPGLALEG